MVSWSDSRTVQKLTKKVGTRPTKCYRNWNQSAPMRSSHWPEFNGIWTNLIRDSYQSCTVLEGWDQSDRTVTELKSADTIMIYLQRWTQWYVNRSDPSPERVADGLRRSVPVRLNGVRIKKGERLHDQLNETSQTTYSSMSKIHQWCGNALWSI